MIRLTDLEALVTVGGRSRVIAIPTPRQAAEFRRAALHAELAGRRLAHEFRRLGRAAQTATYSPGDRHVNRVVQSCADQRLDAASTSVRLIAADVVAEVLDARAGRTR